LSLALIPRRKRRASGRPRRSGPGGRRGSSVTTTVQFHGLNLITLAGAIGSQPLASNSAALSDRFSAIADAFDEFRVIALKYRMRGDTSTVTNASGMAYYPGVISGTQPNTLNVLGENPYVSLRFSDDDVVLPWVSVPRGVLAGEQPWYKSQKATITADDSIPGTLYFVGVGTDTLQYEVQFTVQFRGESDTANTPLNPESLQHRIDVLNKRVSLWHQSVEKQRDQLRKLLTYQRSDTPLLTGLQWPAPTKKPA